MQYNGETWERYEVCGSGDWLGLECPITGRVMDLGDVVFYCRDTGDWMSDHAMYLATAYDPARF